MEKRISARAIIINDDGLVVMYRNKNGNEYYTLPGGGMEGTETEHECVKRECIEEFGISVEPLKKLYVLEDTKTIQHIYYCDWVSGELGTGTGEEFAADNGKGVYNPMQIAFEKLAETNLVPPEIKERILKDYNADKNFVGDRFESVSSVIKLESDF